LSGSEQTRKGSAAVARAEVKAAKTKAAEERKPRVLLKPSLNIKNSTKIKLITFKRLF